MWLPRETCDRFEKMFGLTYDNNKDLYFVNDTANIQLRALNPSIVIGLGTSSNPTERVNIVLPYAAFDLQASRPLFPNVTNYFPIRRAANESQYTLGRVFMQEAYVVVDHERGNFSVHQALFPATTDEAQIVPILRPGNHTESVDSTSSQAHLSAKTLSKASIVGLAIGAFIILTICIAFAIRLLYRRKRERTAKSPIEEESNEYQGMPELPEESKPPLEINGEERFEMHEPPFREIDGTPQAELQNENSRTQVVHEMPVDVPLS